MAVGSPALAQDHDLSPFLDRLDRLEREMNQVQRQVYRGGTGGSPDQPVVPADGSAVSAELRMNQLETHMRTLTGQLEEASYNIEQIKTHFDKFTSETDQRLSALEHAAAAPPTNASPSNTPSANVPPPSASAAKPGTQGVLGQLPAGTQTAAKTPPAEAPALPGATPQDQYNYAFNLLRQADYPAAEQALRTFVQRNPNDPLAGNAQYWLGETFFVRKDYANAASAFAEGYKKYPQSGKGSDNLLKLGMSLGSLGQKKEACLTFGQIDRDYPKSAGAIKERLAQQRKQFGCP